MNTAYDIVIRPVMTEKTAGLMEDGMKVVFRVNAAANKHQIRAAVEQLFGVEVTGVNTMNAPGRARRFGRYIGRRNGYKKAVITLKEGSTFDLFAMEASGEDAGEV